jgi:hypothetical protein
MLPASHPFICLAVAAFSIARGRSAFLPERGALLSWPSMEIPARRDQVAEQIAVIEQALGDQVHHGVFTFALALQLAGDAE